MRKYFAAVACISLAACRIEKAKSTDSSSAGAEPGPGVSACGIAPESHVSEDGLGLLRVGVSLDAIRAGCSVLSESGPTDHPVSARVDIGRDTAVLELERG